jgi:hypothetical protein
MGDLTVIGLKNDGRLVTPTGIDMTVQTVVGRIDLAVIEPAVETVPGSRRANA